MFPAPTSSRVAIFRLNCALTAGGLLLAGLAAAKILATPAAAQPDPGEMKVEGEQIVRLRPFEVKGSVLGSIGVLITVKGQDADDPLAPIFWASVTEIAPGGAGARAGFKVGDELIRLNDHVIRGLTILEFTRLIATERQRSSLVWTVNRGLLGTRLTLVFDGKSKPEVWTPDEEPRPPERSAAAGKPGPAAAMADPDHVEQLDPYRVDETWSGAIEVHFSLSGQNLNDNLNDPILEAYIVDVQGDRAGAWSFLLRGDFLTGLNGKPIKGLTARQLGALVAAERKKGDLVWEVRRGLATLTRKFNGRWIRPLPTPVMP